MLTIEQNFAEFSLRLFSKDGELLIWSKNSGLRPLYDCVKKCREKNITADCVLHDREVGLAAARLITESRCISSVITRTASHIATELLKKNNISITADETVDMILNKEMTGPCIMELKAREVPEDASFFYALTKVFEK